MIDNQPQHRATANVKQGGRLSYLVDLKTRPSALLPATSISKIDSTLLLSKATAPKYIYAR